MITKEKRDLVYQHYSEGSFDRLLMMFDPYMAADWLDYVGQAGRLLHMEVLSLYIEVSLLAGSVHRVESELFPLLKELYKRSTEHYVYEYESVARQLFEITEGIVMALQDPCDGYDVMQQIGSLLDREQEKIQPEMYIRAIYYMTLANIKEGNLLDALAKLQGRLSTKSPYWDKKLTDMEAWLGEHSLLYADAMQFPSRKRAALLELTRMNSWIGDVAISPDGSLGAVMDFSGQLKLFRMQDGIKLAILTDYESFFLAEKAMHVRLVFSPDSQFLAVGMAVGLVAVVDIQRLEFVREFRHPGLDWEQLISNAYYEEYTHVSFSASGQYILIIPTARSYDAQGDDGFPIPAEYGTFYVLNFVTGDLIFKHTYSDRKITASAFSPDERFLAIGLAGKEVELWDIERGQPAISRNDFVWLAWSHRMGMNQTLAFTHNSEWLVYATHNSEIRAVHVAGHHSDVICPLGKPYVCSAIAMDSQDRVLMALCEYSSTSQIYRWQIGSEETEAVCTLDHSRDIHQIIIDETRNQLWLLDETTAELRDYSNSERLRMWNPYYWFYIRGVLRHSYAIHSKNGQIFVGYQDHARIGFFEQIQEVEYGS